MMNGPTCYASTPSARTLAQRLAKSSSPSSQDATCDTNNNGTQRSRQRKSSLQEDCDLLSSGLKENSQLEAILHGMQVVLPPANRSAEGVDAPLTPAASPVSGGGSGRSLFGGVKRPRLPSAEVLEMVLEESEDTRGLKKKKICGFSCATGSEGSRATALLVIKPQLQKELESRKGLLGNAKCSGTNSSTNLLRRKKKTKQQHQQLNYFAIASAFHRAAMERKNEIC